MSSTEVVERPRFKIASYLEALIRRQREQGQEPVSAEQDVPPFAPTSSFVLPDGEVIECEAVVE